MKETLVLPKISKYSGNITHRHTRAHARTHAARTRILAFSLSLSHTHTHTHTHIHTHTHTHTHTRTHKHTQHTHTHTHTHTQTHTTHTHTHTHTHKMRHYLKSSTGHIACASHMSTDCTVYCASGVTILYIMMPCFQVNIGVYDQDNDVFVSRLTTYGQSTGTAVEEVTMDDPLDCCQFRPFWIQWTTTSMAVGTGWVPGSNTILNDTSGNFNVRFIFVYSRVQHLQLIFGMQSSWNE